MKAVWPKPVNVLVSGFNHQLSLSQLADLGVRRISVGSGLALATWGTFLRAAKDIKTNGTFDLLANGAASADLNEFQDLLTDPYLLTPICYSVLQGFSHHVWSFEEMISLLGPDSSLINS